MTITLNKDWLFHYVSEKDYEPDDLFWEKGFDDTGWEKVVLPHDWAVSMPFRKEYSSGTGYLAGGAAWYRQHVKIPKEMEDKSIFIEFDGVYKHSTVWFNGYYEGQWANGYTGFSFDLSKKVCFDDCDNVIAVKVSHPDISDSRWYTGSGINRKVSLVIKEAVHIGQEGIFFTSSEVSQKYADFSVDTKIVNTKAEGVNAEVKICLMDRDGQSMGSFSSSEVLAEKEEKSLSIKGFINNPKLWSVDEPTLYSLETRLSVDGNEVDCLVQQVGIRQIRFHADMGFFLNGEALKLKGVCVHEDAGCLGTAVPKKVWKRRLEKLKTMGCNAIRMSHNPHSPDLYDLCDEMGFLVIDEIYDEWEGAKNKWSIGHNVYPPKHQGYYKDFPQWYEKDIHSFICKNRNHSSIIMWSVGNEIDYPNDPYCHPLFQTMVGNNDKNKPKEELRYNPNKPNMERLSVLAKILTEQVRRYDSTRPVTLAAAFPELSSQLGWFDALDVVGYNYKEQLYDDDHKRFPDLPIMGSENGHSYEAWRAVLEREFISGQFLWTGIDYLGEAFGWPVHGSGAGLINMAGFEKTEYYFRKSLWSKEPMVHIVTGRATDNNYNKDMHEAWNYYPEEMIEVRVFTNQEEVELFINGESLGTKTRDCNTGYITWILPFTPGTLSAKAGSNAEYFLSTIQPACGIEAKVLDEKFVADGEDILQIEVRMVDVCGHTAIGDSSMIAVTVAGEAILLGIENGDISDVTEYSASYRRAYDGCLVIYLRATEMAGEITVLLESEGKRSEVVRIRSIKD